MGVGMEARTSHLVVGVLALLIISCVPALMFWSANSTKQNLVEHYIRFRNSVAGLNVGSDILFGGIPIGHVTAVRIDPQDSSLARVDVSVDGAVPIYSDSKATMERHAISGDVLIDISRGGGTRGRRLEPGEEIPAGYSQFQQLLLGLQEMPAKVDLLINRASAFFNAPNVAMAEQILANVDKLQIQFAAGTPELNTLRAETINAVVQFSQAWAEFQQAAGNINKLTATAKAAQEEIQNLSSAFSRTATNLKDFAEDNRQPIQDFSNNGFSQLSPMISEIHRLGRNLDRLWTEMRQDPVRFFFTDRQQQGFEPPPSSSQRH
jgi:phospholipid/cholesterol/gamma-HCH transport system substrate-binding protein